MLEFLRSQAGAISPACCLLLNCGLHDLRVDPASGAHQVEPESYTRNLEQILYLARAAGAHVVWVRITPVVDARHNRLSTGFKRYNADIERYNALADRLMLVSETPSIDLYRFTLRLAEDGPALEDLYEDHVHFTQPVRRLQAAYIAGWLEATLLG